MLARVSTVPAYDELPVRDDLPKGSSWGVWGDDDVFGTLNHLTAERVAAAAGLVRRGAVFALNLDMELPDPPLFGRKPFRHAVDWLPGDLGHDDHLSGWNTQSSSQWDGFRHMRSVRHGFYNGVADEDHGIHHWARKGIVGRAVLVDISAWRQRQNMPLVPHDPVPIDPEDIDAAAASQGVEIRPGDILLLRTGWLSWYRTLDETGRKDAARHLSTPGLRGCEATAAYLWDLNIAAVAADNPALEVYPPALPDGAEVPHSALDNPTDLADVFVHLRLLPLLGIPVGELFDLDALAQDCATDGVWEGLFTSAPLNLAGGVASPPNALVVK